MHPWRRRVVRWIGLLILAYGVVLLVMMFLQRSLMYPAVQSGPLPAPPGTTGQDVVATTADGLTLHGWTFFDPADDDAARPVVIFLHGNGGNRGHRLRDVEMLARNGADVVLFDYRGYAENAGSPSEAGLAEDARAIWSFVTETLHIPPEQIVLYGESLGGGVAVKIAAELSREGAPPGGLILRSSFSSMDAAAAGHYPWLPVRLVLYDRYDSVGVIDEVTCPILVLHGDADRVVPLELGRRLFAAAPDHSAAGIPKQFVLLPGAGHNDVLLTAEAEMSEAIAQFLDEVSADHRPEDRTREPIPL